jgi:hypothetical protein
MSVCLENRAGDGHLEDYNKAVEKVSKTVVVEHHRLLGPQYMKL